MHNLALFLITIASIQRVAIAHDSHYIGDYGIQCSVENETQELDPWTYLPEEYTDDPDGIFDLCLSYYCVEGYVVARQRFLSAKCAEPIDEAGWRLYDEQASLRAASPTARPNTMSTVTQASDNGLIKDSTSPTATRQQPSERDAIYPRPVSGSSAQFGRQAIGTEKLGGKHSNGVHQNDLEPMMDNHPTKFDLKSESQNTRRSSSHHYDGLRVELAPENHVLAINYIMFSLLLLSTICSLAVTFKLRRNSKSRSHDITNTDVYKIQIV